MLSRDILREIAYLMCMIVVDGGKSGNYCGRRFHHVDGVVIMLMAHGRRWRGDIRRDLPERTLVVVVVEVDNILQL